MYHQHNSKEVGIGCHQASQIVQLSVRAIIEEFQDNNLPMERLDHPKCELCGRRGSMFYHPAK